MTGARTYPGCGAPSTAAQLALHQDLLFHLKDCSYCNRYLESFADCRAFKQYDRKHLHETALAAANPDHPLVQAAIKALS